MGRKLILITGEVNSGKTSFLMELSGKLQSIPGLDTGGFIARGIFRENEKKGFKLVDIKTNQSCLICTTEPIEGWEKVRKFYFNPEAFAFGEHLLIESAEADVIIIDEFGPLELAGGGWKKSIERILDHPNGYLILTVRKSLLEETVFIFEGRTMHLYPIDQKDIRFVIGEITRQVL